MRHPIKPRSHDYKIGFADAMERALKKLADQVSRYQGQELIFELGALTALWSQLAFEARQEAKHLKTEPEMTSTHLRIVPDIEGDPCMATYQKEKVTVIGDVRNGDPGYKPGETLVKIKRADGAEVTVPKAEVQE